MRTFLTSNGYTVLVDDQDYERVMRWRWYGAKHASGVYVTRTTRRKGHAGKYQQVSLHRFLLGVSSGVLVDHVNGNTLDNQRQNLRRADHAGNAVNSRLKANNTSGFRGIRQSASGKWQAVIRVHPRRIYLGSFPSAEEAARVYDAAASQYHGDFARFNLLADTVDGKIEERGDV